MRDSRSIFLLAVIVVTLLMSPVSTRAQLQETFEGFITGVRPNAVKGEVVYQRGDGKFELEPGLTLQEGDFIRSGSNSYAELLLQPGNYLRIGGQTECQIFSDQHDRMRFKLNHGVVTLEILSRETEMLPSFLYSLKHSQELIRIITPNAVVFITEPGIFRINAITRDRTELIVRKGEAVINAQRVKQKQSGVASGSGVTVAEINTKVEDIVDAWARERASESVRANRSLKNQPPWSDKRRQGQEMKVDFSDGEENDDTPAVISIRPGVINFAEAGVELNRGTQEWQPVADKTELEVGDKLRTAEHSFAEIRLLPEMHLRLNERSELLFAELSNDSISMKVLRGSAIVDVARLDVSRGLPLTFGGPSTSVVIAREGNYRVDVTPNHEEIAVRAGKVIFHEKLVDACRRIVAGTVAECDKKSADSFDLWSQYLGEGVFIDMRPVLHSLLGLRRTRFRTTGFWYQNRGQTTYTFVPFTFPRFRSPYGGSYSTVLAPALPNRVEFDAGPLYRLPRVPTPRPLP